MILLQLLLFVFGQAVYPQSPAGPSASFSGLDVTILIDQSGSMWQNPRNDRYAHRIGQTKNLIYRMAEHVEGTPFVHRVSVIDFGDNATVVLSNHVIRYNPSDPGGALRGAKAVVERAVTDKPLRNTNTPEAMRLALAEYAKMDAAQPSLPGRRRVMLIVTDGRPDLPGLRTTSELQSDIKAQAQLLNGRKVEIWVVGLNDASNFWDEGDGAFWKSVAGTDRARLAESASSKIFTIMQDIADDWLGSKSSPLNGDEYYCPPYLRRVVFVINMGQPRSAAGVTDPDGNDIPASSGGPATSPGNFVRFVVEDPKIGVYKIKRDPARSYTWRVEETAADIKRLSPAKATGLAAPARILFQARDKQGAPLETLSDYPINGMIVITPPSGPPIAPIKTEFLGDGKFAARWQPPALGSYRIRLQGLVKLKNGKEVDVFAANASSYDETLDVNNLTPYFIQFGDPDPEDGFRLMRPEARASLTFSVVDAKGNKAPNLAGLVKDPASWLQLELVDQSGAPLGAGPLPLTLGADGTFTSAVTARLDWTSGEGWWTPGRVYLRLAEQPGRITAGNYLDSIQLSEDAEEQRIGGDPLALAMKVRFSWLIMGPLLLGALVLLGGGLLLFGRWALPKCVIRVADWRKGRTVTVKIYDADSDPEGHYGKKFSITGSDHFNYDRVYSVSTDDRDYIAVKLRIKRAPLFDRVEAEAVYSWDNDPKKIYTVRLRKGRVDRLKGLPRNDYAISLEEKP